MELDTACQAGAEATSRELTRHATSARQLLQTDLETDPACSPRTRGSAPGDDDIGPSGSR